MMWNMWGINWCLLSVMKIIAVKSANMDLLKLGLVGDALTTAVLLRDFVSVNWYLNIRAAPHLLTSTVHTCASCLVQGKFKAVGGDMTGFLVLFSLSTAALLKLVFGA